MSHAAQFLDEAKRVIDGLDVGAIERMAELLEQARDFEVGASPVARSAGAARPRTGPVRASD